VVAASVALSVLLWPGDAEAVPAFARKYRVTCTVCHTRPPRLNTYGERFLENGYQTPGTQDGGLVKKIQLGNVTLDQVSNYLAVRLQGSFGRNFDMDEGEGDRAELAFPEILNIYFAGTFTRNVGGFVEIESNIKEGATETERTILTINNIAARFLGPDALQLRIGKLDPSGFYSYTTHRQQILPMAGEIVAGDDFEAPTIERIPLVPAAGAAKFFGLFNGDGEAILPFQPVLYNSVATMAVDLHGRPFGDWFLYQVGMANGAGLEFGDTNDQKDFYAMGRFDLARSDLFSFNVSAFGYFGNKTAKVATGDEIDWVRYGVAAALRWRMLDIYGTYIWDKINGVPTAMAAGFDDTASGGSLEVDTLVTDQLLASVRYDLLNAGGVKAMRKSAAFVSLQLKYYYRDNLGFFLRGDVNLRDSSAHPVRNLRDAAFVGLDIAF